MIMRSRQEIQDMEALSVQLRFKQLAREFEEFALQLENQFNTEKTKTYAREIMLLIEHSTKETNTEQVTALATSQRLLGNWRKNWEELWNNSNKRTLAQAEARAISQNLLEMAGLV